MMTVTEVNEEGLRNTKFPRFRVLTGGKGPPEEPSDNWLAEYETGTTFVCRSRNSKNVDLNLYHVVFKKLPEVILLKWELPDGKLLDYYVDPERFSKQMEAPTILGVVKLASEAGLEQEATEVAEEETNDSNRTDRQADVVLHEAVPGEHQVVPVPE